MNSVHWRALRFWLLLALLFALGLGTWLLQQSRPATHSPASVLTGEELEWLRQHPVLRLAPDPNFPPFEYFDEAGRYSGLIADYYPLIESHLGVRFEITRAATWDEVLAMAQRREVDILGAAQRTPARGQYLNFSQTLIDIPNVIVVPKGTEGEVDFSKLAGKLVAITQGNALDEYVRANFSAIRVVSVADDLAGLRDVSFGRADATVTNLAIASYLIDRHGISNLRVAGDSGRSNALHIASRNDWPILNQILSKGLAAVTETERQTIYRRWIRLGDPLPEREGLIVVFAAGAVFTLLLIVVLLINRSLRRQVETRTASLKQDLAERHRVEEKMRRAQQLQMALHNISEAAHASVDLQSLLERIHQIIAELMPASNFFVAVYDEIEQEISFPYFVDEHDAVPLPRKLGEGGLTETVLKTGEALLITAESLESGAGEPREIIGTPSLDWLGVPLKTDERAVGVIAVQSYSGLVRYTDKDKALLQFVSDQVAMTIERKRAEKARVESAEQVRLIYDTASVAIFEVDRGGIITHANSCMTQMFLCPMERLVGSEYVAHLHPAEREMGKQKMLALLGSEINSVDLERRYWREDGSEFWGHVTGRRKLDARGKLLGLVGVIMDINERKQAEEELHLAASVFTHAREGILITDAEGNIIKVNDAFSRITGYSRDEVLGRNPRLLQSDRQDAAFYAAMWRDLAENGHWHGEIWNRGKGGEIYAEMLTISAVRDAQGSTRQYVALFSDITLLKEHEHQLDHLAHYDALTTLPNRVLLADRLQQAMVQVQRRGQPLAVTYLDLDGFKAINDQHGHDAGDQLLIAIAARMKQALREGDTLARLGGDEFVAVLLDLADIQASEPIIARLLAAADQPVQVGDLVLQVSASLGVTFYPQAEDVDADQLLRQADQAMYQAKLGGKNRYHVFDAEQDRNVRGHHEDLVRIGQALRQGEFVLHYQPKVNMRTGAVLGAEALIRWQHPDRGLLAPGVFLPVIEDHPLAVEVGEWVIDAALAQMERWNAAGLSIPVSVNVGARQLQQGDFVERLRRILAAHPKVNLGELEMEVLETSALEDLARVSAVIEACREMGVRFALDDFGTGYSSLTYLKRLPVAQLKIDQSFVHDMLDDPDDLAILQGMFGLAGAFRREVIAEGVETVEQGTLLLHLGCDQAQGYVIARPMPAGDLPVWIAAWRPDPDWLHLSVANRHDFPLLFASVEHRAWVRAVEEHLKGERESAPPLDHHQCHLGMWLDAGGTARYGAQPAFPAIEPLHLQVHLLVGEMCELHARGRNGQALARLAELHGLRDALLLQLKLLEKEIC